MAKDEPAEKMKRKDYEKELRKLQLPQKNRMY